MTTNKLSYFALALLVSTGNVYAASTDVTATPGTTTDLATAPLIINSSATTNPVHPNIMFILDDSGSMDSNYLPDWATNSSPPDSLTKNNGFNGVAYSSAITYQIPINYNANTASITVGGSTTSNQTVTSVKLGTLELLSGTTSGSKSTSTVASRIAIAINLCSTGITGNCTVAGYSASSAANVVTIIAPAGSTTTATPAVTKGTGTLTFAYTAFTGTGSSALLLNSMTGQSTNTGGDGSATSAAPNWNAVPNDAYGIQSTGQTTLTGNASFYTFVGGEYCDNIHMRNCQATQDASHTVLAQLRWCSDSALTTCQATWSSTFHFFRPAGGRIDGSKATATISISGTSSTTVSSIKVGTYEILSATTPASSSSGSVAVAIANAINACTASLKGNCTIYGYSATVSGSDVTLTAPMSLGNLTSTAVVTKTGSMTATPTAFSGGSSGHVVPGAVVLTIIDPITANYAYPGTTVKATTRTDCAGTTCTYVEEMTNYANWWAFYHTRMQMMKSSASIAFSSLTSDYRVGYMSINNTTGTDFLNPADFSSAQKGIWYKRLFDAKPGSTTPLRAALARAGRMYAGKLNGTTVNGSTVVDPMQYSCQQNYTILSTDGYWNETANPPQLDGTTDIDEQDGLDVRPYFDGASATFQKDTSQILQDQTQLVQSTSQLQSRTQQYQTSKLQSQTSQLQTQTSTLQATPSTLQGTVSQVLMRCAGTTAVCGTAPATGLPGVGSSTGTWAVVTSCTNGFGTASPRCSRVSPSPVLVRNVVGTCNTSATISASSPYTATNTDGGYRYSSCSYHDGTITTPGSCTAVAKSTNSPYTVLSANTCSYTSWSGWVGTSSCTIVNRSAGPTNYSVGTAIDCRTAITSAYADAGSCTVTTTPDASGNTTQCHYTTWTNASVCTPLAQSTGPTNYTVGTACQLNDTGWIGAASCAASGSPAATYSTFDGTGKLVNCQTITTSNVPVATCTAASASSSNSYTQTTCATNQIAAAAGVASCTPVAPNSGNGFIATNCNPVNTSTTVNTCTAQTASASNSWMTVTCGSPTYSGGTTNTLADVAEYYYLTDLRTDTLGNCTGSGGSTLCTTPDPGVTDPLNNVGNGASWQHMNTITLGLGASGYMQYDPSYKAETSGDYYDVLNGTDVNATNSANGICSWQSSGSGACNWPTPVNNSQPNIDDLWHAAVNGRGTYFSASNPASLSSSLSDALSSISAATGTSASATTSNPNITTGDNFLFTSTFMSVDWYGELFREQLDISTGHVIVDASNNPVIDWTAQGSLDTMLYSDRNIYMADPSNSYNGAANNQLKLFTYSNLSTLEQAYFNPTNISPMSQLCPVGTTCLSAANQTAAAGANLVNFLRGDRSNEGASTDLTKYYRLRTHVLGDIVDAEAIYVKAPLLHYADSGFTSYIAAKSARQGMVYAAANDGMLHAFYAADDNMDSSGLVVTTGGTSVSGGDEAWAYVPTFVLPSLYTLADKNYSIQHRYFVDGTPTQGDICPTAPTTDCTASQWKTILVAGLNGGGRGYYALDITNPANPMLLWEFTDANMGYTYGNPEIGKLSDGTWVVIVTSGYNNVSPGDGKGHLYVLNATTGQLVTSINSTGIIDTGAGTTSSPSGLSRITAQVANPDSDATILQVYGGDLEGNLWRFDVNGNVGKVTGYDAQLLAVLKDSSGKLQPITTKPQVGLVSSYTVVYVGTGRFLGQGDISDKRSNTMYAIKDPFATTTVTSASTPIYNDPRNTGNFVQQIETPTTCPANTTSICTQGQVIRTSTTSAVNFATNDGWYVDLPDSGERDNTDPTLQLGTLTFTTNVPSGDSCSVGGYSYTYNLDYSTGGPISSSTITVTNAFGFSTTYNIASVKTGNALGTRPVVFRLPNGSIVECTRMSDGSTVCNGVPINNMGGATRRVSWRELNTDK